MVRRREVVKDVIECGGDKVALKGDDDLSQQLAEALGSRKLSLVLDAVGGALTGALVEYLKVGGTLVGYALVSGEWPVISRPYLYNNLRFQGFSLMNWLRNAPRDEVQATYHVLADLTSQNLLSAKVDATYALDQYPEAFAHAQQVHRTGKILFRF